MLARDLVAGAPSHVALIARSHAETDVTSESALAAAFRDAGADLVINCAAYTKVDQAETERDLSFAVNGVAPGVIGHLARAFGSPPVIHYGTDYVFNGRAGRPYREQDPTDPLSVYGASKLAGERALMASGAPHLIIRTQWLFGAGGRSFPRTMWERAQVRRATRVVDDQVGRPTYTVDLARATWRLTKVLTSRGAWDGAGVVHVANGGVATWYDLAKRVFEAAGASQRLAPCDTAAYPTPAARPAYSVLDTSRYEQLTGATLPPWEQAVDRFLDQLRAAT